jgi:hypothetical protein
MDGEGWRVLRSWWLGLSLPSPLRLASSLPSSLLSAMATGGLMTFPRTLINPWKPRRVYTRKVLVARPVLLVRLYRAVRCGAKAL